MSYPLGNNNKSVEVKDPPVKRIKIEQEIEDEEIEMEENDPSTIDDEDPLSMRVICERIGRKLLAAGKKYCSVCYDIFDNSEELSAHLNNINGNAGGCQGYSEQDLNGVDSSTVEFLNNFMTKGTSTLPSSSSSSLFHSTVPKPTTTTNKNTTAKTTKTARPTTTKNIKPTTTKNTKPITGKNGPVLPSNSKKNNNNNNKNTKKTGHLYKCPFCPATAQTQSRLDPHIRLHITGQYHAYTCGLCPPSSDDDDEGPFFGTTHDWFYHVKSCHIKESKIKGDQYASKKSTTAQENDGEKEEKLGEKCPPIKKNEKVIYVCSAPGCKKIFTVVKTFKHHTEVHEGTFVEYSCPFPGCPDAETKKNWRNLENFKEHILQHRNGLIPRTIYVGNTPNYLLCSVPDCFKNCRGAKACMKHILEHSEKKIPCSICSMEFISDYVLNNHELLHKLVDEAEKEEDEEEEQNQNDLNVNDISSDAWQENFVP